MDIPARENFTGIAILVVEDEELLSRSVERLLRRAGARVTIADTVEAAHEALESGTAFDVIFVDQRLPDGDGLEVLRAVAAWEKMPGIVATSVNLQESWRSLELQGRGAILLPKPFRDEDLLASVSRALAIRPSELPPPRQSQIPAPVDAEEAATALTHGPITVRLLSQTVTVADHVIDLQPVQFRLLAKLMANAGRVLPVTELVDAALRGTHRDGGVNIRFHVHGLRRRLGEAGACIETAPGGYGIGIGGSSAHDSEDAEDERDAENARNADED